MTSEISDRAREEVEGATPNDEAITSDVPQEAGTTEGDLNAAGSEPAGRGE